MVRREPSFARITFTRDELRPQEWRQAISTLLSKRPNSDQD